MLVGFSILIHENLLFFEFQIQNIQKFHPTAEIVVNFKRVFYNKNKREIQRLQRKYEFELNCREYKLFWASPHILNALIDNFRILLKKNVDYVVQFSSNELLLKPLDDLISRNSSNKMIVLESSGLVPLSSRDKIGVNLDPSLRNYCTRNVEVKSGYDFGRIYSSFALRIISEEIAASNLEYFQSDIKYSRSEVVIPTIIENLFENGRIFVRRECDFVCWFQSSSNLVALSSDERYFITKHVPRNLFHPKVFRFYMHGGFKIDWKISDLFGGIFLLILSKCLFVLVKTRSFFLYKNKCCLILFYTTNIYFINFS